MTTSNQIDLDIKIIREGFIQKKWFTVVIPLARDKRETTEIQVTDKRQTREPREVLDRD